MHSVINWIALALFSVSLAGPHEDNINMVLGGFNEYREIKEPVPMTPPINCNAENVNDFYSGNDAKQGRIIYGDSMMAHNFNRLTGTIGRATSALNIRGMLCLPIDTRTFGATYPCSVELGPVPRFWVDDGLTGLGSAWGSAAATGNKFGYGRTFRETVGGAEPIAYLYEVMFKRAELNLYTGNDNDFTCLLFYNKQGLTNDLDFVYKRRTIDDDDVVFVGGSDGTFTLEAYTGSGPTIGVAELFYNSGGGDNASTDKEIGFQVRIDAIPGVNETTLGDRIEILGHMFFPSTSSNGDNVLEGTTGAIACPIHFQGYDASEMTTATSDESREVLVRELGRILGNGLVDSLEPVSGIDVFFGLNEDITNDFTVGLANLENAWRGDGGAIDEYSSSAELPSMNLWAMYSFGNATQIARMAAQESDLHAFTVGQSHRAFFSLHGFFGGINPRLVSGTDPFGNDYFNFTMDNPNAATIGLHTASKADAEAMWDAILAVTHADNLEPGVCTAAVAEASTNRSRDRVRGR